MACPNLPGVGLGAQLDEALVDQHDAAERLGPGEAADNREDEAIVEQVEWLEAGLLVARYPSGRGRGGACCGGQDGQRDLLLVNHLPFWFTRI
jgi:hypothetical protein